MRASSLTLLLPLAACGDGGPTNPPASVASVVTTPAASPPLRGGDSFQFSAQAQDAEANVLPGSITWSIESPELATISPSGLVTILMGTGHGSGAPTVTGSTGGKQGHASFPIRDWSYEENGDPLLGSRVRVAHIDAETGPASLHVRCQASQIESREPPLHMGFNGVAPLQIYVTGEISAETETVTYQLDQQPERGEKWPGQPI